MPSLLMANLYSLSSTNVIFTSIFPLLPFGHEYFNELVTSTFTISPQGRVVKVSKFIYILPMSGLLSVC